MNYLKFSNLTQKIKESLKMTTASWFQLTAESNLYVLTSTYIFTFSVASVVNDPALVPFDPRIRDPRWEKI